MTLQWQAAHPRRAYTRSLPLLVLALLAGLVAMHGLASTPVPAAAAEMVRAAEHHRAAPLRSAPAGAGVPSGHRPEEGRSNGCHTRGHLHGHGSHPEHADAACAARETAGGPLLLPPSVCPAGRPAPAGCTDRPPLPADAPRAPPSPAGLQLLRI